MPVNLDCNAVGGVVVLVVVLVLVLVLVLGTGCVCMRVCACQERSGVYLLCMRYGVCSMYGVLVDVFGIGILGGGWRDGGRGSDGLACKSVQCWWGLGWGLGLEIRWKVWRMNGRHRCSRSSIHTTNHPDKRQDARGENWKVTETEQSSTRQQYRGRRQEWRSGRTDGAMDVSLSTLN
ncbi:hypothetical protein F4859DRAFT_473742 [Xylaria cf. heliscus]|nr:hypothetical protein F4859DRAFT_473742 [Xylaria cf. heliscus]